MFLTAFLTALLISLLATGVVASWSPPARRSRSRPASTLDSAGAGLSAIALFFLLFLLTWAGGLWLAPFGPSWWGVAWAPFLIVALLMSLLIAAVASPRFDRRARDATRRGSQAPAHEEQRVAPQATEEQRRAAEEALDSARPAIVGLSLLYWLLLLLLLVAVFAHYVHPATP